MFDVFGNRYEQWRVGMAHLFGSFNDLQSQQSQSQLDAIQGMKRLRCAPIEIAESAQPFSKPSISDNELLLLLESE